jgi:hypothetical protein
MEISATRDEIRARLIAKVGWAAAGSVEDHYNELIRAASAHVADECPWATARREQLSTLGVAQATMAYPTGCGATGLQEIGLWTGGAYYKRLTRHVISVVRNSDPAEAGGDTSNRAEPVWYEPGPTIEFWPLPDQAYQIKLIYTLSVELTTGLQVSATDAELILLWAAADAFAQIGDMRAADDCRSKYALRLQRLKSRMQTAFDIPLAAEAANNDEDYAPSGYYGTPRS